MAEKGDQADMTRAQLGRKHSLTAASPGVLIGFCIRFMPGGPITSIIMLYIYVYVYMVSQG